MPHELLEHIFQYFVHSYNQLPERLLFVCRTFYVVAINCRALWTCLNPVERFPLHHLPLWTGTLIQSRVARSNPAPLDIDFTEVRDSEMTDEFAKKVTGIPTLLKRCRSIVISRPSELHFFQGSQPLLESLIMEGQYEASHYYIERNLWENVEECPNLRSLKVNMLLGIGEWPDHLFQRLTHLEIITPLLRRNNTSYHHVILPIAKRLQSLTIGVAYGVPQPVIHQSLQTLVLVYKFPSILPYVNPPYTLGEIVCPELRRLEIQLPFSELLSSIRLVHTQKLSDLRLECKQHVSYDEEDDLSLDEKWSDSIVKLFQSIGTIKHLELGSGTKAITGLVESLEADPALCPDLELLHMEHIGLCRPDRILTLLRDC